MQHPTTDPVGARRNHLLGALPDAVFSALAARLEPLQLRLGESIYEPNGRLPYAIFPTTAIVSLHYVTMSGASAETAAVGPEGMVGVALFMGGDTTAGSARVQIAGAAYRMPAGQLKLAFEAGGPLRALLLNYSQALITQIAQIGACNRHHAIEQQFCRWLLSTVDRVPQVELVMTQELIANTLGVRRESVTDVAVKLQQAGVIRYRRGHISVLDRAGLEQRTCECYAVVKNDLQRLLASGPVSPQTTAAAARAASPT